MSSAVMAPDQDSESRPDWIMRVAKAIEESSGEDEWTHLSMVGHRLRAIDPAFDTRAYGFKNLHSLIESEPDIFDLKANEHEGIISGHLVRQKPKN